MNPDLRVIGANLRRIREAKGLTQAEMAERASISRIAYRNIENGKSTPKVSTLQNIAAGAGTKLQDLLIPVRILTKVRFRATKKMNSRENILTEVARWLDDFNDLEILVNAHQDYKFAALTIELAQLSSIKRGDDKAKYAAGRAREILGLKEKATYSRHYWFA
ncbi:MAG: helix-turn-helix transcriptional regulator [Candidatus Syntrophopropionicum ammoniitolerans]